MPGFVGIIAAFFGISPLRLIAYAAILAAIVIGAVTIRQHYINLGWNKAISAVKKQDDRARAAAETVERRANQCSENSYWDVLTQGCREDQ